MQVLIVDDNEDVRGFLMQLLRNQGHAVREAVNGQEGLARVREHRPDAIICDGLMPVMDGFQLLQTLKKDPGLSSIPFIFHTSVYTGEREQELARTLGADAFLVKPQQPEAIYAALRAATAGRDATAGAAAALTVGDAEFAQEYSRVVATALEEKVGQFERVTHDLNRAKKELQDSEAVYRGLFENNPLPMWVYDLETLAFLAVNDAAIISYGFSREEFLALTIKDIRRPEDVQKLIGRVSAPADGFDASGIWKHQKKDGTIIDVEITSHTLEFSGQRAKLVLANDVTERSRMGTAIQHAADEWRATFDAMTEAVALLDTDGRIMRCNRAMAMLTKKPFSELIGQACAERCACSGESREGCPFLKSKKTLKREAAVFKQGEQWFEASADPIVDETGAFQGAVHILQDITGRKRAEEALRASEERHRLIFQGSPVGIFHYDAGLIITDCNDRFAEILQSNQEQLVGLDMHTLKDQRVLPSLREVLAGKEGRYDGAYTATTSSADIWISMRTAPLFNQDGSVSGGVSIVEDVTENKLAEDALKESESKFRHLNEQALVGTYILQDNLFKYVNPRFAQIFGYSVEELTDRLGPRDLTVPEDWPRVQENIRKRQAREVDFIQYEFQGKRKDEQTLDIELLGTNTVFQGKTAVIGTLQDITVRKRAEESIREQQRFTENLIMSSAIATFVVDAEHRVLNWNRACEELTGVSAASVVGTKEHWKAFYEQERPVLADIVLGQEPEKLSLFYESASQSTLTPDGIHAEAWFKKLNNKERYIVFDAAPIRDASGRIIAAIETLQDFTVHKKLEEQIHQAKQDWEYTFNSITDMVTVHDQDYNIIMANKAAEKILNLPMLEKRKGRKCFAYYHGTNHAPGGCPSCSCLQTGVSATFEIFEPHLDMFIEIRAIPRFDSNNKLIGLIHVVRDITERKQAQDALNERVNQAALGAEIGVALTAGGDLQAELQHCAEAMVRHLDAAFARIWTLNEKDQVLEMQASAGMYTHLNGPHGRVPVGKFKIGLIAEERKPHLTNQVVGDPRVGDQEWAKKEGMVAFAGYPLIVQDRLVGVMAMFSRNPLAETTMTSLGSVADIVALGIERKRAEESLDRYSKQLTALNTASNTLLASTSLTDIYQEICNIIYSIFELRMVWLGIVEEGSYEIRPVAHAGREDGYLSTIKVTWDDSPTGKGPTGIAVKTRKPYVIDMDDPLFEPWRAEAKKRGYLSSMAVPLLSTNGNCIGVLNYYGGVDYFTPDSMKLTQIFANQAAIAIENARLVQGLETKVFERTRALEDTNREIQLVNRELVLRREEAEAASRSKTDFLANMSHELRTPLNAIMGFSEIMQLGMAGPISDKQKEFLGDIAQSGKHLLSLINDILDLSKVEAGKMELEPEPVIVGELVGGSLMMFKEKALKHSIKMDSSLDPAVPQIVADRRKLKQVLVNLLSNAFKFTPDGGSVRVAARRVDSSWFMARGNTDVGSELSATNYELDTDLIEISVQDTGVGITPEHQKKLFQPFEQIDSSLTRKHAGTGLGLSLCRRFVELHGGRIWVESEPGKGSTFSFVVPISQVAKKQERFLPLDGGG